MELKEVRSGWAAIGDGWAVFGPSRREAARRFGEAERKHEEIADRPRAPEAVYQPEEWPYGLSCMDCGYALVSGDRYVERPNGMVGDVPATEVVCVDCGRDITH